LLTGFLIAPITFAIVMSYALRPMWADRLLYFVTPFLAIALAQGIIVFGRAVAMRRARVVRYFAGGFVATILVAGFAVTSVWEALADLKVNNYTAAAEDIRAGVEPGDVIFVPEYEAFWGLAWYLIGPGWGSPLVVQDSSPGNFSETWTKILDRLGPVWRGRLHLEPQTRTVSYKGAVMVIGWTIPAEVWTAQRVWLLNIANNRRPYRDLPRFAEAQRIEYRNLTLQLLTREPVD
jgi:hypothetical protein